MQAYCSPDQYCSAPIAQYTISNANKTVKFSDYTQTDYSALHCRCFSLNGILKQGWELSKEIQVNVEIDEDGCWLMSDDIFYLYGTGATPTEALKDYCNALIEYYQIMSAPTKNSLTQKQFEYIKSYFKTSRES